VQAIQEIIRGAKTRLIIINHTSVMGYFWILGASVKKLVEQFRAAVILTSIELIWCLQWVTSMWVKWNHINPTHFFETGKTHQATKFLFLVSYGWDTCSRSITVIISTLRLVRFIVTHVSLNHRLFSLQDNADKGFDPEKIHQCNSTWFKLSSTKT